MTAETQKLTFAEHIQELRKRLMWSLLFVAVGAGIGYALHSTILGVLQKPLNSSLYYTAPTGAFSFIIKLCCVFGLIVALPMVVYQVFAFFGPLLPKRTKKSIVMYAFVSVLFAAAGIAFAYFVSLPAALHFLVNFGGEGTDIQAIITADEYFNFVLAYIAGFAALFQLPLIISFINKVTPLKPSQLLGGTRYVVLGSFVLAAIITPTPDPLNQALMAGPIILLYFLSVIVVALVNKLGNRRKTELPVPAVVIDNIDALIPEDMAVAPVIPQTPSAHVQAPAVDPGFASLRRQPAAQRRLVSDMVVGGRRPHTASDVSSSANRQVQQLAARPRPNPNIRLISDFMPAPE